MITTQKRQGTGIGTVYFQESCREGQILRYSRYIIENIANLEELSVMFGYCLQVCEERDRACVVRKAVLTHAHPPALYTPSKTNSAVQRSEAPLYDVTSTSL